MKKFTDNDPETKSLDVVADNLERLKALFPELITEGANGPAVNVDVLKQLVGDKTITDAQEKYGLNWHGKRAARQLALTPSTGTLRPCPKDSMDWVSTRNLVIEGDNLEVLKLLKKSYAGKVQFIYIDPPYNTGNDFVYCDSFHDNIKNYLDMTGQAEGGRKLSSSTEAGGRFHTDWLNMMYPRLYAARELLAADGVGFISLDRGEAARCSGMLEEIFGDENCIATIVWISNLKGRQISNGGPVGTHEYILCFGRNSDLVRQFRGAASELRRLMGDVYRGGGYEVQQDDRGPYVLKNELYNTNSKFNERTAPTMVFCIHHNFATSQTKVTDVDDPAIFPGFVRIMPHRNAKPGLKFHAWRWSRKKILEESFDLKFERDGDSARVYTKVRDIDGMALKDVVMGISTVDGHADLKSLGLAGVFDTPKPIDLLRILVSTSAPKDALVMDFFAGSGSMAHAVLAQNAADGGSRRHITVQLPEPLDPSVDSQSAAAEWCDNQRLPRTITEIAKERLRRAAKRVKEEHPLFAGDLGFRVFKLDSSNIRAWEPDRDNLDETLLAHAEHLKTDRTEQDILYELLLKLGLDLCVPIETKSIAEKDVHSIGGGVLLVCLATKITRDEVEPLAQGLVAWHKSLAPAGDTTCVFRDSAFVDDVAKTNMSAILSQHGMSNVRSL
jgi:adenine-specific DNA-methyltransferase